MLPVEREIRRVLDAEWEHGYSLEKTGGGHFRATLTKDDEERVVFCPSTPSDYRAIPNMRAELRRTMRDLDGPKEGKPAEAKRKTPPPDKMKPAEASYAIADKLRVEQQPKTGVAHVPIALLAPDRPIIDRRVSLNRMMSDPEPTKAAAEPATSSKTKWGTPEWREQLTRNVAKARAARAAKREQARTNERARPPLKPEIRKAQRFLPALPEEAMREPEVDKRKQRVNEAMTAIGQGAKIGQASPEAKESAKAPTPIERLAALEQHLQEISGQLTNLTRLIERWMAESNAPATTPPSAHSDERVPRGLEVIEVDGPDLRDDAAREQPTLRRLSAWRRPGLPCAKTQLRPLVVRDPRYTNSKVSVRNMSYPEVRRLAREWGYTDEHGHWTEEGAARAKAIGRPDPLQDLTPAEGTTSRGQPYKVSEEVRQKLAENAAKARAAKGKADAPPSEGKAIRGSAEWRAKIAASRKATAARRKAEAQKEAGPSFSKWAKSR